MIPNITSKNKGVGETLRQARLDAKLTLKEISQTIKIREQLLRAMEESDYNAFNSEVHLKNFLKSYASHLGINEEKILALHRREKEESENQVNLSKPQKVRSFFRILAKFSTYKTFVWAGFAGILILILLFFYTQYKAFIQPPVLEIRNPKDNQVITSETFTIEGFTGDPSVKVVIDGSTANYSDKSGVFKVNVSFDEPGLKKFIVVARNHMGRETASELNLIYQPVTASSKHSLKLQNNSVDKKTIIFAKDNGNEEILEIPSRNTSNIEYENQITFREFDFSNIDIYLDNDLSPTRSIDSKNFSINIENTRPIIKNF